MSNSCIDFPVVSSAPTGMRFGFPGEDDTGGEARLFTSAFSVGISTPEFSAGDLVAAGNGTKLIIDDANQLTTISDTVGNMLYLDRANGLFTFGDMVSFPGPVGLTLQLDQSGASRNVAITNGSNSGLELDFIVQTFGIGDLSGAGNGTKLIIDDANNVTRILDSLGSLLTLDRGNDIVRMGDIDNASTGARISIDLADFDFKFQNDNFDFIDVSPDSNEYKFGDINSFNNGTHLFIDDAAQIMTVFAVNGLHIEGDTILIHSNTTLANGAASATGTLTNAPTAGNPTKWIPIDDAGTIRYIPTWL